MCIFSIIFMFFPKTLVNLFVGDKEKEVIKLAATCLFIGAFEQPFIAISHCYSGALKGIGDAKTPFVVSMVSSLGIRLPLIYYFIYLMNKSVIFVWWITTLQWGVDGILMYICFKKMYNTITR